MRQRRIWRGDGVIEMFKQFICGLKEYDDVILYTGVYSLNRKVYILHNILCITMKAITLQTTDKNKNEVTQNESNTS
jgi:hypothetical protein